MGKGQDKSSPNKMVNWDKREVASGKQKEKAWIQDFF